MMKQKRSLYIPTFIANGFRELRAKFSDYVIKYASEYKKTQADAISLRKENDMRAEEVRELSMDLANLEKVHQAKLTAKEKEAKEKISRLEEKLSRKNINYNLANRLAKNNYRRNSELKAEYEIAQQQITDLETTLESRVNEELEKRTDAMIREYRGAFYALAESTEKLGKEIKAGIEEAKILSVGGFPIVFQVRERQLGLDKIAALYVDKAGEPSYATPLFYKMFKTNNIEETSKLQHIKDLREITISREKQAGVVYDKQKIDVEIQYATDKNGELLGAFAVYQLRPTFFHKLFRSHTENKSISTIRDLLSNEESPGNNAAPNPS